MDTFVSTQRRNAKNTIENIVKEIEDKSRELQRVVDIVTDEQKNLGDLRKKIAEAQSLLVDLRGDIIKETQELEKIQKRKDELTTMSSLLQSEISYRGLQRDELDDEIEAKEEEVDILSEKIVSFKERKDEDSKISDSHRAELNEISNERERVEATILKRKQELRDLEAKKLRVQDEITAALEQFRVFESRIHHLSHETGYIIAYKSPSLT